MGKVASLSHDATTALAIAAVLSDLVSATDINGTVRINFSIRNALKEDGDHAH